AGNRQAKRQETQLNRQRTVSSIVLRSSSSGISRASRPPCSALGELREWQTVMCPFGIHTGGRMYVPTWDTPRRLLTRFRIVNMCPFGIRGVSLWDTGFCFFGVVEQRAVPSVEIAGRCDMFPIGVEGRTFGDPPMWGDTIAIDAKAAAGHHRDEAVVLKLTEPALNRSGGLGAEIGGGVAVGSENLSIVQAVYPQIASQNDVQISRAVRQFLPRRRCQGRADQRHERRELALVLAPAHLAALRLGTVASLRLPP